MANFAFEYRLQDYYKMSCGLYENVCNGCDMIEHFKKKADLPGLMFLIVFRKAFDQFNFGPVCIKWIDINDTDICSCVVNNNGHASCFFDLGCGVRQGCPLSPLLYIVCSEILRLLITNDIEINGIMLNQNKIIINALCCRYCSISSRC